MDSLNTISRSERGIWPPRRTLHRCPKEAPMSDQSTAALTPQQSVEYRDLDSLGFYGYRVGNDGSIWSRHRRGRKWPHLSHLGKWWRMKGWNRKGYHRVRLFACDGITSHDKDVHQLVLETFVGPCPPGMECC